MAPPIIAVPSSTPGQFYSVSAGPSSPKNNAGSIVRPSDESNLDHPIAEPKPNASVKPKSNASAYRHLPKFIPKSLLKPLRTPWTKYEVDQAMGKIKEICAEELKEQDLREDSKKTLHTTQHEMQAPTKTRLQNLLSCLRPLVMQQDPANSGFRLDEFDQFQALPTEIRLKIWGLVSTEPRKIKLLQVDFTNLILLDQEFQEWDSRVPNQTRHPSMLHTNREARKEGLRVYEKIKDKRRWAFDEHNPELEGELMANTYFVNFSIDTFIGGLTQYNICKSTIQQVEDIFNFSSEVLCQIQNIEQLPCYKNALQGHGRIWRNTFSSTIVFRHELFENLERVVVRIDDYNVELDQETLNFDLLRRKSEEEGKATVELYPAPRAATAEQQQRIMGYPSIRQMVDDMEAIGLGNQYFDLEVKWKWDEEERTRPEPCNQIAHRQSHGNAVVSRSAVDCGKANSWALRELQETHMRERW